MEGMLTPTEKNKLGMDTKQSQESGEHEKVGSSDEFENEQSNESMLGDLPEVCIAMIFSCLPPREVAKLASVCRSFHAASSFGSVWESMLPPHCKEILALDPDVVPGETVSKRNVLDHLCKPTLLENNTQGLWIDRDSGGLCLSIAARGLRIIWSDDYRYWDWVPNESSLFPEVAQLKSVCWFEAKGEINRSLPPGAYTLTWRMYLDNLSGWHSEPAHFTFSKNDDVNVECKCYIHPRPSVSRLPVEQFSLPTIRAVESGWTEYDVGEFVVEKGEESCSLKFAAFAIHSGDWKSGLFLDGVVVRPTEVVRQIQPVSSSRAESGFHTPESQSEGGPAFQFPGVLRRFFPSFARSWSA